MEELMFSAKDLAISLKEAKETAIEARMNLIKGILLKEERDTFTKEEVLELLNIKVLRMGRI